MDFNTLIQHYGLIALFFGCFLEGETAALAGGVLAHKDLLVLWQVIAVMTFGAMLADSSFFLLARRYRAARWVQAALRKPTIGWIMAQIDAHPHRLASVYRFIPGMRILGPVALAQSRMSTAEFLLRALVSCALWATFYAVVGNAVGALLVRVFGHNVHRAEVIGLLILVVAVGFVALRRYRRPPKPLP